MTDPVQFIAKKINDHTDHNYNGACKNDDLPGTVIHLSVDIEFNNVIAFQSHITIKLFR